MNRHQVLTGACNSGDQCFAVGSVEGIHFTAYAAGCDIAILASDFQRVQVIPGVTHGNIKVSCVDCSTDTGKIAASYQNKVYIFEPTPLLQHESSHKLDYCWYKTASFTADCFIHCLSWNVDGTKLLLGGDVIQIWQLPHPLLDDDFNQGVHFSLGDVAVPDEEISLLVPTGPTGAKPAAESEQPQWICIWQCKPATPVYHLKFSPDGLLFASAGKNDRVVKIWYEDRKVHLPLSRQESQPSPRKEELHYSFVYICHPRAVTGFSWRKTSKYMPRGSVANMLVTSCKDNVCRIWCETILPDDGLVDLDQFDPVATQDPRYHTRRHKKRFMQRLKTIRHAINKRKKQHKYGPETVMTSTQLSGTQSVHDFHKFGIHQNGVAPAFHFHLAGSINPKTDIPLLPTTGNPNDQLFHFQLNWLNNKELQFTTEAEKILQEMHKHTNFSDCGIYMNSGINDGSAVPGVPHPQMRNGVAEDHNDTDQETGSQPDDNSGNNQKKKKTAKLFRRKHKHTNRSVDSSSDTLSNLSCDYPDTNETAVNEYGTLSDIVDRKIENLLRDWHQSPDMLFSIHPQDGSFLVWLVDWLDEYTAFCFRQAQVSFSCRIPHAVPILDARTMSSNLLLYCKYSKMDIKSAMKLSESDHNLENGQRSTLLESAAPMGKSSPGQSDNMLIPNVLMISKHLNGSLNLWQISFAETSKFSTVMSVAHISRACGHRFRTNSASCHPVLPLLLTTSHHNIPEADSPDGTDTNDKTKNCDEENATNKGNPGGFEFCSELILWKVDPVGPLSKSGGIVELARINSPEISAFSNVSWIPTLLPSNTLGGYSNSPSALFVASDGHSLRMYQAVIDARLMLTESGPPKKYWTESLSSSVETTGEEEEVARCRASDVFNIVSLQSTAHPGCIIQLESIVDAKQDWQETQLLHVFQEQLLTGKVPVDSSLENMEAFVDLRNLTSFEEHFYLVLLEKSKSGGSILHMWKITIASHSGNSERPPSVFEPPVKEIKTINSFDDNDNQPDTTNDDDDYYSKSLNSVKISYSTAKVCTQQLPLPENVEVICAVTAAGHLSSASIYPACLAPYLIVTACSDKSVYFWRCEMDSIEPFGSIGGMDPLDDYLSTSITSYEMSIDDQRIFTKPTYSTQVKNMSLTTRYQWQEWTMMNRLKKSSSISIPGKPITVCCAYSGRLAVAYRFGVIRATSDQPNNVFVNLCVAIYECESTGGSEWSLEDTIELNNISIPDPKAEIDLNLIMSPENTTLPVFRIGEDSSMSPSTSLAMSRTKSVPSLSTIHSVRKSIAEYGNKTGILVQKHLVQLDWVSTEDGSHILTVGVGSKILMYAQVSDEIAQISMGSKPTGVRKQRSSHQKRMQKAKSIVVDNYEEVIRWMKLRSIELTTADGLPPLPMHMSWVRSGILVVAMDNEVHVYSQWRGTACIDNQGFEEPDCDKRSLSDFSLSALPNSSMLSASKSMQNFKSSLSISSFKQLPVNTLTPVHPKKKELNKRASLTKSESTASLTLITDLGLFEAARQANPVLPQYHPKQLMELLNFGRIKRVRAILSHLVRCIAGSEVYQATYRHEIDTQEGKMHTIHRQRAMSIGASSPNEKTGICEEATLDYIEIISIPPLPIYALLAADTDSSIDADVAAASTGTGRPASQDYTDLFNTNVMDSDSDSDVFSNHSGDKVATRQRSTSTRSHFMSMSAPTPHQMLNVFGPMQCQLLAKHLTHMLLPGLTSLDQMYLLALADTIATTSTDTTTFNTMSTTDEPAEDSDAPVTTNTESMDECGIKFLLAMRFHSYLLRTLPPHQRIALQKEGLRSHYIVWAFHSEASEELLSLVPSMKKGEPTWNDLKQYGAGWWITNINQLRRTIEKVAKASFQAKKDPMDAAIFYLAMKKKGILWGLFRSVNDKKMSDFFHNNFNEERWRKAALKNAFALLGRQRFLHAAAFFLLGNSLSDAIEVCLDRLNDIQLALVICRLYDGGDVLPESAKKILFTHILGCDESGQNYLPSKAHPDPFLRSIVLWMLKDHDGALQTLLQTGVGAGRMLEEQDEGEKYFTSPSVFNFYNFLRAHPLIIRQNKVSKASEMALTTQNNSISVRDKNSNHDDRITPVERRLFFTTAHAHFKNGCPLLALEVISKLPPLVDYEEVIEIESPCKFSQSEVFARRSSLKMPAPPMDPSRVSQFGETADSYDWSQPLQSLSHQHSVDFDWSMPVNSMNTNFDDKLDLNFEMGSERSDNESDCATKGSSRKNSVPAKDADEEYGEDNKVTAVDIMAQQYKFIACLKVMMEELRTLATGFEVDGGQLRYQLYIWLEKEVESLRVLCSYGGDAIHHSLMDANLDLSQDSDTLSEAGGTRKESRPSLHQIIQADKMNFEAKLSRTARRKQWLKTNQQLLRTLLSYCILQGSGVGGLASVQMELLLLLQELQQERTQQQLLSPLPFPTTLPLLSASIASSKTVIADPIQYLRSLTQDLLHSIVEFSIPPGLSCQTGIVWMMRNLSVALSSSIYQCLCDIDNFMINQNERTEMGLEGFTSHNISCQASHLMSGINPQRRRLPSSVCEEAVNTSPSKWPGVTSLRVLLARERDEESPRLDVLLCESLVAVYMCLLINGLSTYDVHMLYRLVAHKLDQQAWAALFGGGIKTIIKRNSVLQPKGPVDEASKHRMKVHMKAMGQMRKEERQTYEERFVPPELSMITYFMTKPFTSASNSIIGYDSDTSLSDEDEEAEEEENQDNEDDNIWTSGRPTTLGLSPMQQHNDPNSYSWCLIRYAIVRLVLHNLQNFLPLVSMELQELPVSSPLLHAVLKNLEQWEEVLRSKLELFAGPPDNYIPQLILDVEAGIPHTKYEALLKPHNSPFINHHSTLPLKRLWFLLVKEEFLKDIFIRYIFRKRKFMDDTEITLNSGDSEGSEKSSALMKVIHKEQDIITAFAINQANPNCLALSTQKEIVELDIGALLNPPAWLSDENEYDIETLTNTTAYGYDESDFVLVQTPFDQLPNTAVSTPGTPMSYNSAVAPIPNMQQYNTTGRGSNVIIQRNATGVRRIGAHPHLPHYLTGSADGSVRMWEWGHHQPLSLLRQPGCFSKVTKALFNAQGNKCCVSDAEGSVCLWQVGIGSNFSKAIMSLQCHNKTTSDFAFVGSCSLIATAGHSSESKNVCLWDTLLPQRNALVHAFTCHEHGSPAIVYAPQHQLLISGGRKGEICLFDMRQRLMRHTFQAHEAPIKSLALDHEERFFVTGSAEGDIKVWSLDVHQLLSSFVGEHSKNTFFRNVGSSSGVTQVMVTPPNHLLSCGVDGSMKIRKLPDRDQIVQTWSG